MKGACKMPGFDVAQDSVHATERAPLTGREDLLERLAIGTRRNQLPDDGNNSSQYGEEIDATALRTDSSSYMTEHAPDARPGATNVHHLDDTKHAGTDERLMKATEAMKFQSRNNQQSELLKYLQIFSDAMTARAEKLQQSIQELDLKAQTMATDLDDARNRITLLSYNQFLESRIEDEDEIHLIQARSPSSACLGDTTFVSRPSNEEIAALIEKGLKDFPEPMKETMEGGIKPRLQQPSMNPFSDDEEDDKGGEAKKYKQHSTHNILEGVATSPSPNVLAQPNSNTTGNLHLKLHVDTPDEGHYLSSEDGRKHASNDIDDEPDDLAELERMMGTHKSDVSGSIKKSSIIPEVSPDDSKIDKKRQLINSSLTELFSKGDQICSPKGKGLAMATSQYQQPPNDIEEHVPVETRVERPKPSIPPQVNQVNMASRSSGAGMDSNNKDTMLIDMTPNIQQDVFPRNSKNPFIAEKPLEIPPPKELAGLTKLPTAILNSQTDRNVLSPPTKLSDSKIPSNSGAQDVPYSSKAPKLSAFQNEKSTHRRKLLANLFDSDTEASEDEQGFHSPEVLKNSRKVLAVQENTTQVLSDLPSNLGNSELPLSVSAGQLKREHRPITASRASSAAFKTKSLFDSSDESDVEH